MSGDSSAASNIRPPVDDVTREIAEYISSYRVEKSEARDAAHLCLIDTLGCAFEGLSNPECRKLLGPITPGVIVPYGARVPGTAFELDPVKAAFDIGCMGRWSDFSDTYFGAQGSHPSDNIGGILALADHLSRMRQARRQEPLAMADVLTALAKAYEVQGVLSIENSLYNAGLDHALLVKVATAAVATCLLGGGRDEIENALTNAWADGASLCIYRRSPHAGTRKSWAGADASARGVFIALLAMRGEMGYPSALTAPKWGLYDVLLEGKPFTIPVACGCSIVQDIQFKVAVPTVFNSQTAAECAIRLNPIVKNRTGEIGKIAIWAHETTLRLNTPAGPLATPAERDHCVQYVVAIGLLFGRITPEDYESERARDPRIDALRAKTEVVEDPRYTRAYVDPASRASANAVQVFFTDGSSTDRIAIEYPLGHPTRRGEALPLLQEKFETNVARVFAGTQRERIVSTCLDRRAVEAMPVHEFVGLFAM